MHLTRKEALVALGTVTFVSIGNATGEHAGGAIAQGTEGFSDTLAVISQVHLPEIMAIFQQAYFHAILNMTRVINQDAENLEGALTSLDVKLAASSPKPLSVAQRNDIKRAANFSRTVSSRLSDIVDAKVGFEKTLTSSAERLKVAQSSLQGIAESKNPNATLAATQISEIVDLCVATRALIDTLAKDDTGKALLDRLTPIESYLEHCSLWLKTLGDSCLYASINGSVAVFPPSEEKVRKILSKFVSPTLWWPGMVRATVKDAFREYNGKQYSVAKRVQLINNAIWPFDRILLPHRLDVAKEIAKGE
jgi:hypothetical protein